MKKIIMCLILMCLLSGSLYSNWEKASSGLAKAQINSLAISDDHIFAGLMNAGLYASTDYGYSWVLKSEIFVEQNIMKILVNDDKIMIGTSFGGFYVSTDNGDNWVVKNNGLTYSNITGLAMSGTNIYAGAPDGIYRSDDYGENWTKKSSDIGEMYIFAIAAKDAHVVVSTSEDIIYLSNDYGETWTEISSGSNAQWIMSLAFSGENLIVGCNGIGIFNYSLQNETWSHVYENKSVHTLETMGNNIFAGTHFAGIHFSSDNGQNWIPRNEGLSDESVISFAHNGQFIYAGSVKGNSVPGDNGNVFRALLSDFGITSVEEINLIERNYIYPNPSDEYIYLSTDLILKNITITDILGKTVLKQNQQSNELMSQIDISKLKAGIYFLNIETNGTLLNKIFIKN